MRQSDNAGTDAALPSDRDDRVVPSTVAMPSKRTSGMVCIHHGGRAFLTTSERAGVFLRSVQEHVNHGRAELVPLLHSAGLDLLFVGARTPLIVHDSRDRSLDRSSTATADYT